MARYPTTKEQTRPKFHTFVSPEDVQEFMSWVKENYKTDKKLAVWYGDHLFGKALQPVEGNITGDLTLSFDESFHTPEATQ